MNENNKKPLIILTGPTAVGKPELSIRLAKEVGGRGVRVNAIAPGFIETDMTDAISEEARKGWLDTIPLKRSGKPLDVANAAVFLGSDLSTYITAQVLGVDGGMGA